jgi:hypothetical protein
MGTNILERRNSSMFKKEFIMISSVLIILIALNGCVTTLQSYQPKGPEEIAIKELLMKWENTFNNHDAPGNLALWNDNARIMYGRERQIASKKEYNSILPERMKSVPSIKVGSPDIKVSGSTAEVKVTLTAGNNLTATTFDLIKENGLWSILSWKY